MKESNIFNQVDRFSDTYSLSGKGSSIFKGFTTLVDIAEFTVKEMPNCEFSKKVNSTGLTVSEIYSKILDISNFKFLICELMMTYEDSSCVINKGEMYVKLCDLYHKYCSSEQIQIGKYSFTDYLN